MSLIVNVSIKALAEMSSLLDYSVAINLLSNFPMGEYKTAVHGNSTSLTTPMLFIVQHFQI